MKKPIGQITNIRSGYQFRGRVVEDPIGNVRVIQIKDIDGTGRLDVDRLSRVQVDSPERHLVQKGEVLFLSRGRQLLATEIIEPMHDVIATSYYFILAPIDGLLLPGYLAWTLNQPSFQRWLSEFIQTTSVPWVSKSDFEHLPIECPTLDVQQQVVDLVSLHGRQKQLTTELIRKREQLVATVCMKLVSGQLKSKEI